GQIKRVSGQIHRDANQRCRWWRAAAARRASISPLNDIRTVQPTLRATAIARALSAALRVAQSLNDLEVGGRQRGVAGEIGDRHGIAGAAAVGVPVEGAEPAAGDVEQETAVARR